MFRKSGLVTTIAVSCVAALLLAGCASSAPQSVKDANQATSFDPNGTFRMGYATDGGKNYDPVTATNPFVGLFLQPAYDTLFQIGKGGLVAPMLAELTETSTDGKVLTLKLREDVLFHDGTKLTSDVVRANIERGQTSEKSVIKNDLASIESVEVVSDHSVKLHLTAANGALPAILTGSAGMMVSPDALANPDLDLQPVGAGPYRVVAHQPGVSITYERFDDYYNVDPETAKTIEVVIQLDSEARMQSLIAGELDAGTLQMDQVSTAEQAGLNIASGEAAVTTQILILNMGANPALANADVRAAMSMALDRNGISKALLNGRCTPTAQIFQSTYWASSPELSADLVKRDVAGAKKMLVKAGYPDGFSMSLSSVSPAPYRAIAEALAAQLEEIGIDVDLQIGEPAQVVGAFTTQKTADSYSTLFPGATDPSRTVASLYLPTGIFNPGGYVDDQIVTLAAKGLEEADVAKRTNIYQNLSKAAAESTFHIPVCSGTNQVAVVDGIEGLSTALTGTLDMRHVKIVN